MPDFDYCPNCGAELPARARACPECGSDEKTGWSDSAHADRLGIPDDDFNYDRFAKEEFGEPERKQSGRAWFRWLAAAIMILILLGAVLGLF